CSTQKVVDIGGSGAGTDSFHVCVLRSGLEVASAAGRPECASRARGSITRASVDISNQGRKCVVTQAVRFSLAPNCCSELRKESDPSTHLTNSLMGLSPG